MVITALDRVPESSGEARTGAVWALGGGAPSQATIAARSPAATRTAAWESVSAAPGTSWM